MNWRSNGLTALTFLIPAWLGAATLMLQVDPDRGLNNQVTGAAPVKCSGCTINRAGIAMNSNSVLQYQVDGGKLAQAGTLILEFKPDRSRWAMPMKDPEILFQLGNQHWEPNNITIIREPTGWVVTRFHDGANQQSFENFFGELLKNSAIDRLGMTWNKDLVQVYLNGGKLYEFKPTLPAKLADLVAIGCATNHPGWAFTGTIVRCRLYDGRTPPQEMEALTLVDERAKPLRVVTPYLKKSGELVQIGNQDFEIQVSRSGIPAGLYDKKAGKFLNTRWNDGSLWGILSEKTRINLNSTACSDTRFSVLSTEGRQVACWAYEFPAHKGSFKAYVWAEKDGALAFRYALENRYDQPIQFVYFPTIGGIRKSPDGWVVQPHWNGERAWMRDFKYMCWGGPGHMSMMFIGLQTGDSTLLYYPDDTPGSIRFAIADDSRSGPDGIMNLSWQNWDYVMPGEKFRSPHTFRLYNLGNTGLKGIAEKYREWACTQPWFMTWEQKLKQAPVIADTLNGVIKMVGFEAYGKDGNVYADKAYKEKNCKILAYNYHRFLEVARTIEKVYQVKPAYRYDGWWGRFDSRYPDYFPVDSELGDFKQFMDANNRDGRLVFLHTNPIQWDSDNPDFDVNKMSMSYANQPECLSIWSRNKLYFCSPSLVKSAEVEAEKQMTSYGVKGIFEDVIGCTTMVDCNTRAGYQYHWRDSGTIALTGLSTALRAATPGCFRGTENGTERGIPNYDAFMLSSQEKPEHDVPLFQMVYGDCFANSIGIDGGGEGLDHISRARGMLFGIILGLDGRFGWAAQYYSPAAQMIFETQALQKNVVGKRILDYNYAPQTGLALTQWQDAVVFANLGKNVCPTAEFENTTLGNIRGEGLQSGGAVLMLRDGRFVAWGCRTVTLAGKTWFRAEGADGLALAYNGKTLAVANPVAKFPEAVVTVAIPAAGLTGAMTIRPENAKVRAEQSDTAWKFTIPAGKTVYLN